MLRRDGIDFLDAKHIKVSDQRLGFWGIDFIGGREDRLAGLSQEIHDLPIHRCQPVPSIQDENQRIRLCDGEPGLLANQRVHKVLRGRNQAAGVDQPEGPPSIFRFRRVAVARYSWEVLDDRLPAPQDTIEERGLADIGPADDGDSKHARSR